MIQGQKMRKAGRTRGKWGERVQGQLCWGRWQGCRKQASEGLQAPLQPATGHLGSPVVSLGPFECCEPRGSRAPL